MPQFDAIGRPTSRPELTAHAIASGFSFTETFALRIDHEIMKHRDHPLLQPGPSLILQASGEPYSRVPISCDRCEELRRKDLAMRLYQSYTATMSHEEAVAASQLDAVVGQAAVKALHSKNPWVSMGAMAALDTTMSPDRFRNEYVGTWPFKPRQHEYFRERARRLFGLGPNYTIDIVTV